MQQDFVSAVQSMTHPFVLFFVLRGLLLQTSQCVAQAGIEDRDGKMSAAPVDAAPSLSCAWLPKNLDSECLAAIEEELCWLTLSRGLGVVP